jgi:hypothetical protein
MYKGILRLMVHPLGSNKLTYIGIRGRVCNNIASAYH